VAGYVFGRRIYLCAVFLFVPLGASSQVRVDTLLGRFAEGWREAWMEQLLADNGNDFRASIDGEALRVRSDNSASAIWRSVDYDGDSSVTLSWRWKIERTIHDNARERERAGDDFPARFFVVFEGTPFESRSRAICYVWASTEPVGTSFINPHVNNVATVVLQSGDGLAGRWIGEDRDVVQDFTELYGRRPAVVTGVAIMADTDNTRTATVAWFDDVEASISRLPNDRH
jgi:hypothetical protein